MADGPVVEEASRRALSDGVSLRGVLTSLRERKGLIKAGVVLMGYVSAFCSTATKTWPVMRPAAACTVLSCPTCRMRNPVLCVRR